MKLPEITYNVQVQRFATRSPFLPVARARTRAFGAGMIKEAAAATGVIATDIHDRDVAMSKAILAKEMKDAARMQAKKKRFEDEIRAKAAKIQQDESMTRFIRQSGEIYVDNQDVPPTDRARIVREQSLQLADDMADEFSDSVGAMNFRANAERMIEKYYVNNLIRDKAELDKIELDQQEAAIEESVRKGNYPAAIELIKQSGFTQTRKDALIYGVQVKEETDPIELSFAQAYATNDTTQLEFYLGRMSMDRDKYEETGGVLLETKRADYASQLRRAIGQINANKNARDTSQDKWNMYRADNITETIKNGGRVPPDQIEWARTVYTAQDRKDKLLELGYAQSDAGINTILFNNDAQGQIAYIEGHRAEHTNDKGEWDIAENEHQNRRMIKTVQQLQNDIDSKGVMQAAYDRGLAEQIPVDFNQFDETIRLKTIEHDKVAERWRRTDGMFTPDEMELIQQFYTDLPENQKFGFVGQIAALEPYQANLVFEQFKEYKIGTNLGFNGQMILRNRSDLAKESIRGMEAKKGDSSLLKGYPELKLDIRTSLNGVYGDNITQHNQATWTIENIIANRIQDGVVTIDDVDSDYISELSEEVVGNMYVYKSRNILLPPGVSDDRWETFIEDTHPSYINSLGKPIDYTNEQLLKGIDNGTLTLTSDGENEYIVRDKEGFAILDESKPLGNGKYAPFIFAFNEQAITKKEYKEAERLMEEARVPEHIRKELRSRSTLGFEIIPSEVLGR